MKRKISFSLFFILSCGLLLRLYRLGIHELWYDEAKSHTAASFTKGLWIIRRYDTQPPFYYLLLRFWMKIVPDSEFWLRLPSVLFAILAIFALYKLCDLFFTHRTAILASFIIAISPIHIWYAQELRPYSLVPFFIILISYFFIKVLEEDKYALNLEAINIDKFRNKKILIVSGSWSRDGTMDENSKAVNLWMEKRFKKISEKEFDGIFVSVYE